MTQRPPEIQQRNNLLFIGIVALFSLIIAYKVALSPIVFDFSNFDFTTLLNLILALFAIGMSLAFYFKATDTSNLFYDNTYKFTKDISEILGRMEAGFGERLKHLDEGYEGIRERVERMPADPDKAKAAIQEEENEVRKWEDERKALIEELANRAQLNEMEKKQIFKQLHDKDAELSKAKEELNYLRHRFMRERVVADQHIHDLEPRVRRYLQESVIPEMGGPERIMGLNFTRVIQRFASVKDQMHPAFIEDLRMSNLVDDDGNLTNAGAKLIRRLALLSNKARE